MKSNVTQFRKPSILKLVQSEERKLNIFEKGRNLGKRLSRK